MSKTKIKFVLASCLFAGLSFSAMATSSQDNQILENNGDYSNIITSESGLTFGFKDDGNIHNLELQGPVFKMTGSLGRGWSRFLNATPTTDGAVFNTSNGGVSLKVGLSGFTNLGRGFTSRSLAVVDKTVFILTNTNNLWSKPLEGGNGVNHGNLEGATQMVSIGNDLVFFFADGTLQTSESATPVTLTQIGRDWGETTKIYPFSKTHFLIESGSGTIFLKDKKGNSKRIGKYSPGLLVDGTKRIYKLGNGKLVFQPAGAPGQIASGSNDHLTRIGYTRIHISGNNHRCWMRSAWYTIFNRFKNNSDQLVALLYDLQFRNEDNLAFGAATNYVIENIAAIVGDSKFLVGNDGKYQGALDDHLYTITYQLLSGNEEYRQVMINNRSGTTDMMVRLTMQFDNSNFHYMSVLQSQVDVFQHNGFIEQQVVVLVEELRDAYPLLVYHTGGHFEIDRLLSPEERLQYAQQQLAAQQVQVGSQSGSGSTSTITGSGTIEYNDQGFAKNGQHRNGTRYDQDGFDINGLNIRGFRRNKNHSVTGTLFDEEGFNIAGRDENGRDINGYNEAGFNERGYSRWWHRGLGIATVEDSGAIVMVDELGQSWEAPLSYSSIGFDQLGFQRPLPHAAGSADEKYDFNGYNAAGRNFLGLTQDDFRRYGYDAILQNDLVKEDNLDNLITMFNKECYQLYADVLMDNIEDGDTLNLLAGQYRSNDSDFNYSDEDIKGHLKKSIYVCQNFLFAGDLTKNSSRSVATLRVSRGTALSTKIADLNYARKLEGAQKRLNLNYIQLLKNALTNSSVLSAANYLEDRDSSRNKRNDINSFLDAYGNGWGVQQRDKGRYILRLMAEHLSSISLDEKIVAANYMLHGAAHCPDAKRNAIDRSFKAWLPHLDDALKKERIALTGDNFYLKLLADSGQLKEKHLHNWVMDGVRRNGGDENSTYAAEWDVHAARLGLDIKNARYRMFALNQNLDNFFRAGDRNGNYTPQNVYYFFNSKSDLIVDLREKVLGPLYKWIKLDDSQNEGAKMLAISSTESTWDHPFVRALLVRFGFLE